MSNFIVEAVKGNHYDKCDAVDKDPEVLGRIEAAIDALRAKGIEKLAFDVEGVLIGDYVKDVGLRLRRSMANPVLAMTADRMPQKPLIWTAYLDGGVHDLLNECGVVLPRGVSVVTRNVTTEEIGSPRNYFRKEDRKSYTPGLWNRFLANRFPDDLYVTLCACHVAQQFGKKRLTAFCGLPEETPDDKLIAQPVWGTSLVDSAELGGMKYSMSWSEWGARHAKDMYQHRIKLPHMRGIDVLFDDQLDHRAVAVMLGYPESARAVCHVPSFTFHFGNGALGQYNYNNRYCFDSGTYFKEDTGLVDALEKAAR